MRLATYNNLSNTLYLPLTFLDCYHVHCIDAEQFALLLMTNLDVNVYMNPEIKVIFQCIISERTCLIVFNQYLYDERSQSITSQFVKSALVNIVYFYRYCLIKHRHSGIQCTEVFIICAY